MSTKKIKANKLKIDENLTSIREINRLVVNDYREKYLLGEQFPPIIVAKDSRRVVSGNHRLTAFIEAFGDEASIEAIEKEYSSEKEVLADFAKQNSAHGMQLDGWTKKKLIHKLSENGATTEEIADSLSISPYRVKKYAGETVVVVGKGNRRNEKVEKPRKRGFHPPDNTVTEKQYENHVKHDKGFPLTAEMTTIIRRIYDGTISHDDKTIEKMKELRKAIDSFLKS